MTASQNLEAHVNYALHYVHAYQTLDVGMQRNWRRFAKC